MASKSIDIKCPECGASGRFEIWNSIDLEENPPLEEKARSGALFRYACPECGIITKVAYPTLIHDSANKRMIYLATDKEMFDSVVHQYSYGGSSAAGGLLEGDYMVRVVKTVPELSELLRIIHAGLDDRVTALLKLFVFQEVSDNNPDYEFDNLYFMDRDESEREYFFELQYHGETVGQISFDRTAYDNMEKMFAASIEERADELEKLYKSRDYKGYTVKVHALKSMAKSIGASELSELAAEMEEAGKNRDIAALTAGAEVLLSLYRSLAEPLKRLAEPLKRLSEEQPKKTGGTDAEKKLVTDRRRRLLLVDDDDDFLALTTHWLKKDYVVTAVNSGKKALKYLEKERPDLVLLDYEMPEMDGSVVLEKIRGMSNCKDLPVVFLTGTEDRENVKKAEQLHPEGFLIKTLGKKGLLMGIATFFD